MRANKLNWVDSRIRKPTIDDSDLFGYVLCRIRKGRNWMFADLRLDDPAMVEHGWQWLAGANEEDDETK